KVVAILTVVGFIPASPKITAPTTIPILRWKRMTGSFPLPARTEDPPPVAVMAAPSLVLSFYVEEHNRVERAAGLTVTQSTKDTYAERMETVTRRLLERLAQTGTQATFFIVGEIARSRPKLVFDIAYAGHEVAAHSWDHRGVHRMDAGSFAED